MGGGRARSAAGTSVQVDNDDVDLTSALAAGFGMHVEVYSAPRRRSPRKARGGRSRRAAAALDRLAAPRRPKVGAAVLGSPSGASAPSPGTARRPRTSPASRSRKHNDLGFRHGSIDDDEAAPALLRPHGGCGTTAGLPRAVVEDVVPEDVLPLVEHARWSLNREVRLDALEGLAALASARGNRDALGRMGAMQALLQNMCDASGGDCHTSISNASNASAAARSPRSRPQTSVGRETAASFSRMPGTWPKDKSRRTKTPNLDSTGGKVRQHGSTLPSLTPGDASPVPVPPSLGRLSPRRMRGASPLERELAEITDLMLRRSPVADRIGKRSPLRAKPPSPFASPRARLPNVVASSPLGAVLNGGMRDVNASPGLRSSLTSESSSGDGSGSSSSASMSAPGCSSVIGASNDAIMRGFNPTQGGIDSTAAARTMPSGGRNGTTAASTPFAVAKAGASVDSIDGGDGGSASIAGGLETPPSPRLRGVWSPGRPPPSPRLTAAARSPCSPGSGFKAPPSPSAVDVTLKKRALEAAGDLVADSQLCQLLFLQGGGLEAVTPLVAHAALRPALLALLRNLGAESKCRPMLLAGGAVELAVEAASGVRAGSAGTIQGDRLRAACALFARDMCVDEVTRPGVPGRLVRALVRWCEWRDEKARLATYQALRSVAQLRTQRQEALAAHGGAIRRVLVDALRRGGNHITNPNKSSFRVMGATQREALLLLSELCACAYGDIDDDEEDIAAPDSSTALGSVVDMLWGGASAPVHPARAAADAAERRFPKLNGRGEVIDQAASAARAAELEAAAAIVSEALPMLHRLAAEALDPARMMGAYVKERLERAGFVLRVIRRLAQAPAMNARLAIMGFPAIVAAALGHKMRELQRPCVGYLAYAAADPAADAAIMEDLPLLLEIVSREGASYSMVKGVLSVLRHASARDGGAREAIKAKAVYLAEALVGGRPHRLAAAVDTSAQELATGLLANIADDLPFAERLATMPAMSQLADLTRASKRGKKVHPKVMENVTRLLRGVTGVGGTTTTMKQRVATCGLTWRLRALRKSRNATEATREHAGVTLDRHMRVHMAAIMMQKHIRGYLLRVQTARTDVLDARRRSSAVAALKKASASEGIRAK